MAKRWRSTLARLNGRMHQFLFGAAMSWVLPPHTMKRRDTLERMFMLMTVGDLMGVSLVPPPTALTLLPFVVPQILYWRRRLLMWDEDLEEANLRHIGH